MNLSRSIPQRMNNSRPSKIEFRARNFALASDSFHSHLARAFLRNVDRLISDIKEQYERVEAPGRRSHRLRGHGRHGGGEGESRPRPERESRALAAPGGLQHEEADGGGPGHQPGQPPKHRREAHAADGAHGARRQRGQEGLRLPRLQETPNSHNQGECLQRNAKNTDAGGATSNQRISRVEESTKPNFATKQTRSFLDSFSKTCAICSKHSDVNSESCGRMLRLLITIQLKNSDLTLNANPQVRQLSSDDY